MELEKLAKAMKRTSPTEWRLMMDGEAAATGKAGTPMQAYMDAAECCRRMFPQDSEFATLQMRFEGRDWETSDAAW